MLPNLVISLFSSNSDTSNFKNLYDRATRSSSLSQGLTSASIEEPPKSAFESSVKLTRVVLDLSQNRSGSASIEETPNLTRLELTVLVFGKSESTEVSSISSFLITLGFGESGLILIAPCSSLLFPLTLLVSPSKEGSETKYEFPPGP